jgi:hypothetical protein
MTNTTSSTTTTNNARIIGTSGTRIEAGSSLARGQAYGLRLSV